MLNYGKLSLKLHEKFKGKLEVKSKVPLKNKKDLSAAYTPGVAQPCVEIAKNPKAAYKYTIKTNTVLVATDGSAVLGLGNIGPLASLPVMEGKCLLFKRFANIDAFPLCIDAKNPDEFIQTVKSISPVFGGVNLEDIAAPNCFYIEEKLKKLLQIPVFHDDQHGTAIVILAGLINACKVVKKDIKKIKIVISGAGAAGIATANLLVKYGVKNIILADSRGIIYKGRKYHMNFYKKRIAKLTNPNKIKGTLADALKNSDVFIGVSSAGIVNENMIKSMNKDAIVFAMANPTPEIMPEKAFKAGAKVIATGRSDYPNQINNVLAFPGIFRGALDAKIRFITDKMKISAAEALANLIKKPIPEKIIPAVFEKNVSRIIAEVVKKYI